MRSQKNGFAANLDMKNFNDIQQTVTPEWLRAKLDEHGLRVIDFRETVGVTSQAISEILNDTPGRPQRQSRVILYLYFLQLSK